MLNARISLFFILVVTQVASSPVNLTRSFNGSSVLSLTADSTLTNDNPIVAENDGNDLLIKNPGTIDIVLNDRTLNVTSDIRTCFAESSFCYKAHQINKDAVKGCPEGYCLFRLQALNGGLQIFLVSHPVNRTLFYSTCGPMKIDYATIYYCSPSVFDSGCSPHIDAENKTTIIVKKNSEDRCAIKILNSKVYVPTTLPPPAEDTFDYETLTIVLVCFGIFLLIFVIGIILCCMYERGYICNKKKQASPVQEVEAIPKVEEPVIAVMAPQKKTTTEETSVPTSKPEITPVPPPPMAPPLSKKKLPKIKKVPAPPPPPCLQSPYPLLKYQTSDRPRAEMLTASTESHEIPTKKKLEPLKEKPKTPKPKKSNRASQHQSKAEENSLENSCLQRNSSMTGTVQSTVKSTPTETIESKKSSRIEPIM